jgi:hypothetical protein
MQDKLNKIIMGWIGENLELNESNIENHYRLGRNHALQDLRQRTPELSQLVIEAIEKAEDHDKRKLLDGFSHDKNCEECRNK